MASYNIPPELNKMQQEAFARVQEMKRRSLSYINNDNLVNDPNNFRPPPTNPLPRNEANSSPNFEKRPPNPPPQKEPPPPPKGTTPLPNQKTIQQFIDGIFGGSKNKNPSDSSTSESEEKKDSLFGLGGLLGDLKIDEEKAIIGLLIYLVYKNGGDLKLLLALGYLLL